MEGFIGGFMPGPKLTVSVEKEDNGWMVHLNEAATCRTQYIPPPEEAQNPEEILDNVIDALRAFFASIHEEDDSWKGKGNRAKLRKAMKTIFPGVTLPRIEIPPAPRAERRVFTDKDALLKYLAENL